ncbi:MAG: 50S ribosomal protein L25/general stress protein Ctc [Gammaproteobacteria bacterium]|jgi:large subunit ribosomal protein L25
MAQDMTLAAELRSELGKGANRRLRRKGQKVPGILYGGGEEPVTVAFAANELAKIMESEAFFSQIVTLELDGKPEQAILRDLQRHPATERVLHLDFLRIRADQALQVHVPIHFLNEDQCVGVRLGGGMISHNLIEVEVACLPGNLPEFIEVDMAPLEVGQSVYLTDLPLPEGVSIVALMYGDERNVPVASVQLPRGGLEEEEEAEAAELEEGEAEEGAEGEREEGEQQDSGADDEESDQ